MRPEIEVPSDIAAAARSVPCKPPPLGAYNNGNGYWRMRGSKEYAHRWSYRQAGHVLASDETLDHLCHTLDVDCPGRESCPHRACCEPLHLQPVTSVVNSLRGGSPPSINARKETCGQGHPLALKKSTRGGRYCPTCADAVKIKRGEISALGRKTERTHCPQGHEYTAENTYVHINRRGHRCRSCRTCWAQRAAQRRQRKKEVAP